MVPENFNHPFAPTDARRRGNTCACTNSGLTWNGATGVL